MLVGAETSGRAMLEPLLASPSLQPVDILWARERRRSCCAAPAATGPISVVLALPAPDSTMARTLEELKRTTRPRSCRWSSSPTCAAPIGRADLVVSPSDSERLIEGLGKLLGRVARKPEGRARVVVVEDELEILDFTRFVLEREGYDVVSRHLGPEALAAIDDEADLVILDIVLADADGIEICRELKQRERPPHVPVLMVTAMTGEAVERRTRSPPAPTATWSSRSASTNSSRKCACTCATPIAGRAQPA